MSRARAKKMRGLLWISARFAILAGAELKPSGSIHLPAEAEPVR
jgi:hypothetical protein